MDIVTETLSLRSCNVNCRFYCVPCIVVTMCYYYILFVCICKYAYYSCTVRAHVDTIVLYIYTDTIWLDQNALYSVCSIFKPLYPKNISTPHFSHIVHILIFSIDTVLLL